MQEELKQAMQTALSGGLKGDLLTTSVDGRQVAGGALKAMVLAKDNGCECEPCKLLRPEMEQVLTVAMKSLADVLLAPPEPVTTTPAPAPVEVTASAPGPDTPA